MGYDTPETYKPRCDSEAALGQKATAYLTARLRSAQTITPEFSGTDKYDRALVALTLDGTPLAQIMVRAGLAQPYSGRTKRPDWCALLARRTG